MFLLPATRYFARIVIGILARAQEMYPVEIHFGAMVTISMPSVCPVRPTGEGRLGLVAIGPGFYDLFHGKATSVFNLAAGHEAALLSSVTLGVNETADPRRRHP